MQVPLDWYAYIVPGFIYIGVILLFIPPDKVKQTTRNLKVPGALVTVLITLIAYVLGFAANTVITQVVRPGLASLHWMLPIEPKDRQMEALFNQVAPNNLVEVLRGGYVSVLFLRSVFFALFLFTVRLVFYPHPHNLWTKVLSLIFLTGLTIIIAKHYAFQLDEYNESKKLAYEFIKQAHNMPP